MQRVLSQLQRSIQDENPAEIKMIVTNEYFWGKVPFDNYDDKVVKECKRFSEKLINTIFCINSLMRANCPISVDKIGGIYTRLRSEFPESITNSNRTKLTYMMSDSVFDTQMTDSFDNYSLGRYFTYLRAIHSRINGKFQNTSMIFFNGNLLTSYNKSTYADEYDDLLYDHLYEFGEGKDNSVEENSPAAGIVFNNISTQICRDLAVGIRTSDTGLQKIHILESNTIPFNGASIPSNVKYVIHADYNKAGVLYKKNVKFSSASQDPVRIWDQIGPFDFHVEFRVGSSNYTLQSINVFAK
jgi:hypothetical protein